MENKKYTCPHCEGTNIQARAWVDINSYNKRKKFQDIELDTCGEDDRFFCIDCSQHIVPNEEDL